MKVLFSFCSGEPKGLFATLHRISIQQTGCLPKGLFDKIVLRLQIKKNVKSTCNITALKSLLHLKNHALHWTWNENAEYIKPSPQD